MFGAPAPTGSRELVQKRRRALLTDAGEVRNQRPSNVADDIEQFKRTRDGSSPLPRVLAWQLIFLLVGPGCLHGEVKGRDGVSLSGNRRSRCVQQAVGALY